MQRSTRHAQALDLGAQHLHVEAVTDTSPATPPWLPGDAFGKEGETGWAGPASQIRKPHLGQVPSRAAGSHPARRLFGAGMHRARTARLSPTSAKPPEPEPQVPWTTDGEADRLFEQVRAAGVRVTNEPVDAGFFAGPSVNLADPEGDCLEVLWVNMPNFPVVTAVHRAAGPLQASGSRPARRAFGDRPSWSSRCWWVMLPARARHLGGWRGRSLLPGSRFPSARRPSGGWRARGARGGVAPTWSAEDGPRFDAMCMGRSGSAAGHPAVTGRRFRDRHRDARASGGWPPAHRLSRAGRHPAATRTAAPDEAAVDHEPLLHTTSTHVWPLSTHVDIAVDIAGRGSHTVARPGLLTAQGWHH